MATKTLAEMIAERRSAIERLRSELDVLEKAHALQTGEASVATREVAVAPPAYSPAISSVDQAVLILKENPGVPLHVDEIIRRAKARGVTILKATLVSNLVRLNKLPNPPARRVGPNTFVLGESRPVRLAAPPGPDVSRPALALMARYPHRAFDADEIAKEIGVEKVHSLRSALARMHSNGEVERVGRGKYRIAHDQKAVAS